MRKRIVLGIALILCLSACAPESGGPSLSPSPAVITVATTISTSTATASASPEATAAPTATYVIPASYLTRYGQHDPQPIVDIANKNGDSARLLEDGSVEITTSQEKYEQMLEGYLRLFQRNIDVEIRDNDRFSKIEFNDDCTEVTLYTTPAKTVGMGDGKLESYCSQAILYQYHAGVSEEDASVTLTVLDEVTGNQLDQVVYPKDLERFLPLYQSASPTVSVTASPAASPAK